MSRRNKIKAGQEVQNASSVHAALGAMLTEIKEMRVQNGFNNSTMNDIMDSQEHVMVQNNSTQEMIAMLLNQIYLANRQIVELKASIPLEVQRLVKAELEKNNANILNVRSDLAALREKSEPISSETRDSPKIVRRVRFAEHESSDKCATGSSSSVQILTKEPPSEQTYTFLD